MTIPLEMWSLFIASSSLAISATVAYLTLFRKGHVRMTQPTTIYFGPDAGNADTRSLAPKIYLRTLLYSTSKRGNVLSSLHVRVTRGETTQTFNVWVYGEEKLNRGSGLYVGEQGIVLNHHFLPPSDTAFKFVPGKYKVEMFAARVDHPQPQLLWSENLELPQSLIEQMEKELAGGVYFDWQPNSCSYHAHMR